MNIVVMLSEGSETKMTNSREEDIRLTHRSEPLLYLKHLKHKPIKLD